MNKPVMYGKFHLIFVGASLIISTLLAVCFKNVRKERRIKVLSIIGSSMIILEIIKQWYLTFRVNGGRYDWFHFPFQLCSMPMYLASVLPFHKKWTKGIEAFLFCYGFFAAAFAFAYPQDMLSADLFLLLHSFLYHGIMLFMALWSAFSEEFEWHDFNQASILFLMGAGIAEIINIIGYFCHGNPDMFYISPFMPATQPLFRNIAEYYGRPFEIVLYLALIIGANALLFYLYKSCRRKRKDYNERIKEE